VNTYNMCKMWTMSERGKKNQLERKKESLAPLD
jgi:hypothetical protein